MKEIVLEKKNIIYGFIDTPKGYEVDLNTLKGSALYYFFIDKKRISDNPLEAAKIEEDMELLEQE